MPTLILVGGIRADEGETGQPEQITAVLQQVRSGVPVGDVCRQVGISEQTFYHWKRVYGGMPPSEARELKQRRDENTKLKRLVADPSLDKVMLQDIVPQNIWSACCSPSVHTFATSGNGRDRFMIRRRHPPVSTC